MPRTNSMSSSGRSLTSDEEDVGPGPTSPMTGPGLHIPGLPFSPHATPMSPTSPRAAHNHVHQATLPTSPRLGPAAAKLKRVAQKIIHMKRTSALLGSLAAGAEPGVDPNRSSAHVMYGHLTQPCQIDVVDYSSVRSTFREMDNAGFTEWVQDPLTGREPWVKVRWIHVNGISWDVLSRLAILLRIHPLALEDILHSRHTSRTKASYYPQHLFLRVLCHSVADKHEPVENHRITDLPRSLSPVQEMTQRDPHATLVGRLGPQSRSSIGKGKADLESPPLSHQATMFEHRDQDVRRRAQSVKLKVIKEDARLVHVALTNLFILLFRDGTVVTIYASPNNAEFAVPIIARLKMRDTMLRSSADPSLLVESLLDLVVDQTLEVVDNYNDAIVKLEAAILTKPKVNLVRALHILSGDLSQRKRSLEPMKTLIFGLRRYDLDRCVALAQSEGDAAKVKGFMSHKAKVYLADVHDHMEYALSSMDLFAAVAENLISYTFNLSGYQTNETMRRLTLITIICLPLTLLTGYFGMNFADFWSAHEHSDLFFWEVAIPVMLVVLPIFLYADIGRGVHYMRKRLAARHASRAILAQQYPNDQAPLRRSTTRRRK